MESQLIESDLLESDLDSNLADDESYTAESQLETTPIDSTDELDLFTDLEETSPLYSNPLAMEGNHTEQPEDESPMPEDEATDETSIMDVETPEAESDVPLTNSVTAGNPEGTQFTFNFAEDTPQEVIDGVKEAAENWSSILTDDVDINIDFTFNPDETGLGTLGNTVSEYLTFGYGELNEALAADATSANDNTAIANLPEEELDILINNTSENSGSDTPYLDNNGGFNNSNVRITRANAKALGIGLEDRAEELGVSVEEIAQIFNTVYPEFVVDPNSADATINLSSNINWDFDSSDGINSDSFDFVGTVTHEIGHALGFESNADVLDLVANRNSDLLDLINSANSEEISELFAGTEAEAFVDAIVLDQFISENEYLLQPFDFFRYTPESVEQGAIDFTAGNVDDKYFSIDGGQTEIAPLSEGRNTGDMEQLSHWEDNLGIGIMDPTGLPGELLLETADTDLIAFDVIGWDLA